MEVYLVETLYCQERRVYNIELHIASERDKLATHFKKWEKLVAALTPSRKLTLSYPTFSWSPVLYIL